jgi:hypothetical protein
MYYTEMGPAEKKFSVQFFLKCEKCGPKWVLQGKKIAAQKIWLVTFSFQGGDLLPLVLYYSNTMHIAPDHLSTGRIDLLSFESLGPGAPHRS